MKKLCLALILSIIVGFTSNVFAVSYGDLYDVEWCPCNSEERFDSNGSVVLGKTVMCPCDSMYDGYKSTMEKDIRKLQHKTKQTLQKAKNFKYYVGFDYNKSQINTGKDDIYFEHEAFTDVKGIGMPAGLMLDHQDNIGIVIGTRPHSNFGIEAFYNRAYSKNVATQMINGKIGGEDHHMIGTFTTSYQAFGIDVLGYLPVTDYFDFIGFVGLGQYQFDNEAEFEARFLEGSNPVGRFSYDFSEDSLGWRVGGGIQFNIARGLVLRAMYRYIKVNAEAVNSLQEYSLGIRFLF